MQSDINKLPLKCICAHCGAEQNKHYKFCSNCGRRNAKQHKFEQIKDKLFRKNLNSIILYSILTFILLLIMAFTEDSIEVLVCWTIGFAMIDLLFAAYQPKVYALFQLSKIRLVPLSSVILICIASGFVVSYSMDRLNMVLFEETYQTIWLFIGLDHPLLYSIIIIALFPALFEELAFRGFVYNNFKFLSGTNAAMWGSSFLFALVHFSLLSLVWILPFGLLLAYFRNKYSTILYGIIGHFTHNATTILIEYYQPF